MSFEKQLCEKCRLLRYCVDTSSLNIDPKYSHFPKQKWLCETCYGWILENAHTKDTIISILVQCGLEDIEYDHTL